MNIPKSISLVTLFLVVLATQQPSAQTIKPIYSRQLQYTITNGIPQKSDKKNTSKVESGFSNVRYALDKYFDEKKQWVRNVKSVRQSNIKFYVNGTDSLMTTMYTIFFDNPVKNRDLNTYVKTNLPPNIMPEEDYLCWKDENQLMLLSVYSNISADEISKDYKNKQKKLKLVQDWLKENTVE